MSMICIPTRGEILNPDHITSVKFWPAGEDTDCDPPEPYEARLNVATTELEPAKLTEDGITMNGSVASRTAVHVYRGWIAEKLYDALKDLCDVFIIPDLEPPK